MKLAIYLLQIFDVHIIWPLCMSEDRQHLGHAFTSSLYKMPSCLVLEAVGGHYMIDIR